MMLDELQRRNYAQSTVEAYVSALREFAEYFKRPPDQLGPDHIRQFQLHPRNAFHRPDFSLRSLSTPL
jgi:hypothetical protein